MKTVEFRKICYRCGRIIDREFCEKDNWEGSKIVEKIGVCIICRNKKEDQNGNLESVQNYLGRNVRIESQGAIHRIMSTTRVTTH